MNASKFFLFTFLLIFCGACSSSDDSNDDNDDCTKTVVVQAQQVVTGPTGTTVIPEVTQEVPCDFEDPVVPIGNNVIELENFTYQILSFNFIPDTGNNTRILQFEIQLNNPNNFIAEGTAIITTDVDGLISAGPGLAQLASNSCFSIDANSNCILSVDLEESLNTGIINEYTIIDVDYWLNPED